MLTKELLCFRTSKEKIFPKFLNPEDQTNIEIAEELLLVFSESIGNVRETVEATSRSILERFKGNYKVAKGLEKLLYDRTEFDIEPKEDLIKLRKQVFNCSSKLLMDKLDLDSHVFELESDQDLSIYRNQIADTFQESIDSLKKRLYGDLPPYQKVLRFRKISSEKLLHRYNCALVQGLLLRSEKITIRLANSDTARLRQILKYLRFNKLLVKISFIQEKENLLILEVDGPLSIFLNTQKYGFNLAKFFPAILLQNNWELLAEVRIKKNRTHFLKLNQDCGIISHYQHFFAYIPEEIKLLSQKLNEKMPNWELTVSSDYIHLGGEFLCFPDYLLRRICGTKKVYLELFHPWHCKPLSNRLEQVEKIKERPLLIGIDRVLLKDKELLKKINSSNYFSRFGFFFREIPSASKISILLNELFKK